MNIDKDKEVEKAVNGFKDLMSALGWNITQEKKTDNNKLDKDIEIVKELANKKYDNKTLNTLDMVTEKDEVYILSISERQATENVVSELESNKGKIILSDEEYNKVIENAQKDIKKETETWKKIAEKLAEVIDETNAEVKVCEEKTECDENCKQCIIDWAKREVENE